LLGSQDGKHPLISFPNTARLKQNNIPKIYGWQKLEKMQRVRLIYSLKAMSYNPKASQCHDKDREKLLAFYNFPTDHWPHIRTSNPIESTFSTIRLRTKKIRASVIRTTILTMVYKLGLIAEKGWRKLRGFRRLDYVINGIKFIDEIDEQTIEPQRKTA
jgi:hypothetical protein